MPLVAGNLRIDLSDHLLEIFRMGEVAIDRCVTNESDVIEALQRLEHLQTDFL